MSYVVFALKWRPKVFTEIVGQPHIVSTLTSAIEKQRLAHAYLFAGPRGVGKTSTARILAKALNCKEGPTASPCGVCSSCTEITKGSSLDVIEIDGASNRGIDEIRQLRENVKFAPVQGRFKVYIIDEVHQITPDGFNALLKTLEEPPEYVKFIFATTHPHKILPTILSRCHRLDFRRITVKEIMAQLKAIAGQEKLAIDEEVLYAIAKAGDGSLRDAESILDQIVSFSQGKVSLKDVVSVLGMVEQETLFAITDSLARKDAKEALSHFNGILDEGKDLSAFAATLIEHFRNLMVARVSAGDPVLLDLPQEVCERLVKQSQQFTAQELFTFFTALASAQEMARRFDSGRIPFEVTLVQLAQRGTVEAAAPKPVSAHAPGPKGVAGAPSLVAPGPKGGASAPSLVAPGPKGVAGALPSAKPAAKIIPEAPKVAPPSEASFASPIPAAPGLKGGASAPLPVAPGPKLEKLRECWQQIIASLSKVKMSLATYLAEGELTEAHGNIVTVEFPKSCAFHRDSLDRKDNRDLVEKMASDCCGAKVRFNFLLSHTRQDKHDNPVLKTAIETFGAKVVKEELSGDLYGLDRKADRTAD